MKLGQGAAAAVAHARGQYGLSERHACRLLGQWRGSQRYTPIHRTDEDAVTRAIVALASHYERYGYRRITALLRRSGWRLGTDRVQRIWRREGLKVPARQTPRGRPWLHDGSCVRLRPERAQHVWSYDLVSATTHDGRTLRLLTLIDEYTRECLAIRVALRLGAEDLLDLGRGAVTPPDPHDLRRRSEREASLEHGNISEPGSSRPAGDIRQGNPVSPSWQIPHQDSPGSSTSSVSS